MAASTFADSSASATSVSPRELSDLMSLDRKTLDSLYAHATPGPMPSGRSRGKALFAPGTAANVPLSVVASAVWQGKVFYPSEGLLKNRVFGFETVKARIFEGTSWFDGKPANLIDYKNRSWLVPFIRDEIRLIAPNLYLGRAYTRTPSGNLFLLDFALQF